MGLILVSINIWNRRNDLTCTQQINEINLTKDFTNSRKSLYFLYAFIFNTSCLGIPLLIHFTLYEKDPFSQFWVRIF